MTKKVLLGVLVLCGAVAFTCATPKTVKADAFPCTVEAINQANAAKSVAEKELAAAQADFNVKAAALKVFTDAGITTGNEYLAALNAYNTAKGVVEIKSGALYNANNHLKDCTERSIYEDNFSKSIKALADLNVVQSTKLDYDNAVKAANGVAENIANINSAIAGYKAQLAACPSVQAIIDELNSKLVTLNADYNAKLAVVNAKKAAYDASLNSDYASYDREVIDYVSNRDSMRKHVVSDLNNDGVIDGNDYFIGVKYMQDGSKGPVYFSQTTLESFGLPSYCYR